MTKTQVSSAASITKAALMTLPLVLSFSFASSAVIFSGPLAPYFAMGARAALISIIVSNVIAAWRSQCSFHISTPDPTPHAILSTILLALSTQCIATGHAIFPTVFITIVGSTLLTGLLCYSVGRLKLGNIIRYVPYPVLAGFIAATGVLLFKDAGTVMSGITFSYSQLLQTDYLLQIYPGILYGLLLCAARLKYDNVATVPILLITALIITYSCLAANSFLDTPYALDAYFFKTNDYSLMQLISMPHFSEQIQWPLILKQSGYMLSFAALILFTLLLNDSNLEAEAHVKVDLDHESRLTGFINACCGVSTGLTSVLNLGATTLNKQAGSTSRWSASIVAAFAGILLLIGPQIVTFIPKYLISGFLIYVAFITIRRWLFQAWSELSMVDYGIIVTILIVADFWGVLQGISIGLAISSIQFIINYSRILPIKFSMPGSQYHSNVLYATSQRKHLEQKGMQLHVIKLQGYLFFGTSHNLLDYIQSIQKKFTETLNYILLDFKLVDALDASAGFSLLKIKQFAEEHEILLIFTHINDQHLNKLKQAHILDEHDPIIKIFPDLDYGITWCEEQILGHKAHLNDTERLQDELKTRLSDPKMRDTFLSYLEQLSLPRDQYLFYENDEANDLYLIAAGRLSVVHKTSDGHIQRLRAMGAGSIIGELGFYMNVKRTASIAAELDSKVYKLSFAKFWEINNNYPDLALALHTWIVQLFAERLVHASHELEVLYAPPMFENE